MSHLGEVILLVGLGNPGPEYAATRHNVGFLTLDAFLEHREGRAAYRKAHGGLCTATTLDQARVICLKPQTFMNLSGDSVARAASYHKVQHAAIIVIHDEVDLPFGRIRIKNGGGFAGHNGLRSIGERLGGQDFLRLRFGIGRPERATTTDHVLSAFRGEERAQLPELLHVAVEALVGLMKEGPAAAMNRYNGHLPEARTGTP